jgi:hypothetical protein
MIWLKSGVAVLVLLALVAAAASVFGARRWDEATRALYARLDAARLQPEVTRYVARDLAGLPAPVQRYLRAVLKEDGPAISAVALSHTGTFNASATGAQWRPFRSTQRAVMRRPGFVWNARIEMLPAVDVSVHDAYVEGEGILHAAILGLVPVSDQRDRGELARGELLRFLAESAWYPTLLLPGAHLQWEPVDDRSARATLADGSQRVSLTFRFNEQGLIDTVRADARGRMVGGRIEQLPWEGRFWNYAEFDGVRVPLDGEVAWLTPEGARPYWRGTIESLAYEFAR